MQKLVIDTNVLISSLIQRSYPYQIVTEIISNNSIELCISAVVFEEYSNVLNRAKFATYPDFITKAETLLANIARRAVIYSPTIKVILIKILMIISFLSLLKLAKLTF